MCEIAERIVHALVDTARADAGAHFGVQHDVADLAHAQRFTGPFTGHDDDAHVPYQPTGWDVLHHNIEPAASGCLAVFPLPMVWGHGLAEHSFEKLADCRQVGLLA